MSKVDKVETRERTWRGKGSWIFPLLLVAMTMFHQVMHSATWLPGKLDASDGRLALWVATAWICWTIEKSRCLCRRSSEPDGRPDNPP